MHQDALASDFPPGAWEAWTQLAMRALKGADLDSLTRLTRDGIRIRPLYTRGDAIGPAMAAGLPGASPLVRGATAAGTTRGWDVRVRHAHPEPARLNQLLIEDLERGATSCALRVARGPGQADDGVVLLDLGDMERTLAGVHLDLAPLALEPGGRFAEAAALLLALVERRGLDPRAVGIACNADPLGAALAGEGPAVEEGLRRATALAALAGGSLSRASALAADGRVWHAAGASEAQELAATIATAVAYLRALDQAGMAPSEAAARIVFILAADADFFMTVAKLRALRRLWARVLDVCGVREAAPLRLHAETATRMYGRRDPWVNILRGTVACFAAAAGGAQSITVLPFDHALGLPGPLARRIARNTQLILQEESSLHRVIDPAGGAYYVESLTDELARRAWELFQRIEAEGGMVAACRAGVPQGWVAATWAAHARDLATRREPLTGISEFPHLDEPLVEPEPFDASALRERAAEHLAGAARPDDLAELLELARAGRVVAMAESPSDLPLLPRHRLGEAFEDLRERSDRALARDGRRPRVLLANLGPAAQHTVRATFAKNLLEAGGIEAVWSEPLTSGAEAEAAFRASGARIAALCSSDEVYDALAVPAGEAIAGAGCELVCLLGKAGERRRELEAAGVGLFIHAGRDMVQILADLHDRLGTPGA